VSRNGSIPVSVPSPVVSGSNRMTTAFFGETWHASIDWKVTTTCHLSSPVPDAHSLVTQLGTSAQGRFKVTVIVLLKLPLILSCSEEGRFFPQVSTSCQPFVLHGRHCTHFGSSRGVGRGMTGITITGTVSLSNSSHHSCSTPGQPSSPPSLQNSATCF
jgi:hypothetical protein